MNTPLRLEVTDKAQTQIAVFFASFGTTVIDPDGAGPFFEVPLVGALPEVRNFIP